MPCAVTKEYISGWRGNYPWQLDGQNRQFIYLLLAELGSVAHMDRLTVYLSRPNLKKGAVGDYWEIDSLAWHLAYTTSAIYGTVTGHPDKLRNNATTRSANGRQRIW
jgi:hypothetical protein